MKKILLIFIFVLTLAQSIFSQENNCEKEMKSAFQFIIQKYIEHIYNQPRRSNVISIAFIFMETSFDTSKCTFSLLAGEEYYAKDIDKYFGKKACWFDSNIVIFNGTSFNLARLLNEELFELDLSSAKRIKGSLIQEKPKAMSGDGFGIKVVYDHQSRRILSYNNGTNIPIFIFHDYPGPN